LARQWVFIKILARLRKRLATPGIEHGFSTLGMRAVSRGYAKIKFQIFMMIFDLGGTRLPKG
jgi:hypothetical protein